MLGSPLSKSNGSLGSTIEVSEIASLALGSLIVGDGSGAPQELSVGSNGAFLQALSSEATGVIWRTSFQMVDSIDWTTGIAKDSAAYQILRSTGGAVDRLTLNAPQTAQIELAINGQAQVLISETEVHFQNNIVTIDGPLYGSLAYFDNQTSDPSAVVSNGVVYTKDVASITELHYVDSSGNVVQITSGGTIAASSVSFDDDEFLVFGTGNDVSIGWETADASAHYLNIFLGESRNIIISEDGNVDWTHDAQTNPTLWIQSADSATVADYISLAHDQTNAQIAVGAGDLVLTIAGGNLVPSANDAWALGVSGTAVSDIFLASGAVIDFLAGDVTITHSANLLTMAGGSFTITDAVVTFNKASAGIALDLNCSATSYTSLVGLIDIVRSGALTGVNTEIIIDFNIAPAFTLTEPGVGSVSYYGAVVDLTGVSVTAGVGTSSVIGLQVVAKADADIGTSLALWIVGKVQMDGGGTNAQATATGGVLEIKASSVTGNNASSTIAVGSVVSLGVTTFLNGTASLTMTDAASLYISGIPVASTNVIFTNTAMALWVDDGLTRLDGGVTFAGSGQSTLNNYTESTFTPTVTLVGGAGNTTPVYLTNTGRYTRIGNRVFVDIYLTGDGGAEGAGTGTVDLALPIQAGASQPNGLMSIGSISNSAEEQPCYGLIQAGTSSISLSMLADTAGAEQSNIAQVTGADQNNATRSIRLQFFYEV